MRGTVASSEYSARAGVEVDDVRARGRARLGHLRRRTRLVCAGPPPGRRGRASGAQQGAGEQAIRVIGLRNPRRAAKSRRPANRLRRRHGQRRQARDPAAPPAPPLEDRARPRRRRLHRRRLRDRRAAGAGPAVGQPHRQRLRRLRRHQRRLAGGRADRQRRHARADDAGRQRPGACPLPADPARDAAAAQLPRVRGQGRQAAVPPRRRRCASWRATSAPSAPSTSRSRSPTRCPSGALHRRRRRGLRARGARGRGPHRRLPRARLRAVPGRHRPRHLRADRARRRGLGRRADLLRRARLDGAADGLRAAPGQGPRARRRRHRLDHQPRHRGRGGREVHRRRQPAGALRERLHEGDPDAVRHPHAARVGHGLPEDRLPDVQAARLPAPARDGRELEGALPGRRHRPDRARARRRADVPDEHPQLQLADRGRPPRLPLGHRTSSPRATTSWREVASRHGIQISATRVRKVVEHYGAEKEKTRAWRRILEQTTGTLLRQSAGEQ